jgi:hypothetical protein
LEAEVGFLGDDDVVEDAEAEKFGGFGQLRVWRTRQRRLG